MSQPISQLLCLMSSHAMNQTKIKLVKGCLASS